jgi:hypothetical protein
MDTLLKAKIEAAIDKVINAAAEEDEVSWDNFIHSTLVKQMTNAAEAVFDSAQDAQKFYIGENQ